MRTLVLLRGPLPIPALKLTAASLTAVAPVARLAAV